MKILSEEEKDKYAELIDAVAEVYIEQTINAAQDLGPKMPDMDTVRAIGTANGQVVYDKVIELTESMTKEEVVKLLAGSLEHEALRVMVENRDYFFSSTLRVMMKKWGNKPK